MRTAAKDNPKMYLSVGEIADILHASSNKINGVLKDLKIPSATVQFDNQRRKTIFAPDYLLDIAAHVQVSRDYFLRRVLPEGDESFDYEAEKAAKTHYEKELAKLKLESARDGLFSGEEILRLSNEICLPLKQFLLSIPSMMINRLGSEHADVVELFERDIQDKLIPLLENGIAGSLQQDQSADVGTAAAASEAND